MEDTLYYYLHRLATEGSTEFDVSKLLTFVSTAVVETVKSSATLNFRKYGEISAILREKCDI